MSVAVQKARPLEADETASATAGNVATKINLCLVEKVFLSDQVNRGDLMWEDRKDFQTNRDTYIDGIVDDLLTYNKVAEKQNRDTYIDVWRRTSCQEEISI